MCFAGGKVCLSIASGRLGFLFDGCSFVCERVDLVSELSYNKSRA
jgi:hypothetical protein